MTAFNVNLSALLESVMAYPGMAHDISVIRSLYYMVFAVGGLDIQYLLEFSLREYL